MLIAAALLHSTRHADYNCITPFVTLIAADHSTRHAVTTASHLLLHAITSLYSFEVHGLTYFLLIVELKFVS